MPRPRTYQREGIVLRQLSYGEADRILTIITPEGKVRALAKGVRRPTSRKSAHLGRFARSRIMFAQGRNLEIVIQAESRETFEGLRHDLERFAYASYVGELTDRVSQEDEANQALYDLLLDTLRWLDREEDLALGTRFFEVRLLGAAGLRPELFTCVSCRARIEERTNFLSPELGGMLCPDCRRADAGAAAASVNAQKVLRYLQCHCGRDVRRLRVGKGTHAELEALLLGYLEYTFERGLASAAFVKRLRDELEARRSSSVSEGLTG